MPDIVSRIRVEAQGADQAAREILKLRDAYVEAGNAARGLSANVGGGADPFTKAAQAGGGATQGGNSPAEVGGREERTKRYKDDIRERESKNNRQGKDFGGVISQGFGVADSLSQGKGGSAVGGIAGMLSGIGGPIGVGIMATAAIAMGVQKFGDKAWDRMQETFGSGMSQRTGLSYAAFDKQRSTFANMGIPMGMVKSFYDAAGVSGVNLAGPSTMAGVRSSLDAATLMGTDPTASAGLIGSLNRGNVDISKTVNTGMFSIANSSFGRANTSLFVQSLQSLVDSASSRGIDLTSGSTNTMTSNMAALAKLGGFSSPGAATFASQLQNRGIQAAGLTKPEDVIAFQAMRREGESVTDTMLRMEQNPFETNQKIYQYIKESTGGDKDVMRLQIQKYLGEGTTLGAVEKWMKTQEGMLDSNGNPLTQDEVDAKVGKYDRSWQKRDKDTNYALDVNHIKNTSLFKTAEDDALALSTGLAKLLLGGAKYDPYGVNKDGDIPVYDAARIEKIESGLVSIQSVASLNVAIASVSDLKTQSSLVDLVRSSTPAARSITARFDARTDKELDAAIRDTYRLGGGRTKDIMKDYDSTDPTSVMGIGSLGEMASEAIMYALTELDKTNFKIGKKKDEVAENETNIVLKAWEDRVIPEDMNRASFLALTREFQTLLRNLGFVMTDSGYIHKDK